MCGVEMGRWLGVVVLLGVFYIEVEPLTDPTETAALRALKAGFIDSGGFLRNWDGDDPCGDGWRGVFCVETDYPLTLAGSGLSHVTELRLLELNLSGMIAQEVGNLNALMYLDVMWNALSGPLPASIGLLKNLKLLLLNGNQFTGVLPPEIGFLPLLSRIQIDQNRISGPIPDSFRNLVSMKHLHMNNNSLSGSIPSGLGSLPNLVHVLLDNNELNGTLPTDLANAPSLLIIQLDNNRFDNTTIPSEYGRIPHLLKLSLRNCSLQGLIPDLSGLTSLEVLDLSDNFLSGFIPNATLSQQLTSIDLSENQLSGGVPEAFGLLPSLQYLVLRGNQLSGLVPKSLGTGANVRSGNVTSILDFQDNSVSGFENGSNLVILEGVGKTRVWLAGNPFCSSSGMQSNPLCIRNDANAYLEVGLVNDASLVSDDQCEACPSPFELAPSTPALKCKCAAPIIVKYRLKSPGFSVFDLYEVQFYSYISAGLNLSSSQVMVKDYEYQVEHRLALTLLLFPTGAYFNKSEETRIYDAFAKWQIPDDPKFGPYELISFTDAAQELSLSGSKGLSNKVIAGIVVGCVAFVVFKTICMYYVIVYWMRKHGWEPKKGRKRSTSFSSKYASNTMLKVAGVKAFAFDEVANATDNFSEDRLVGQGGYGKVYSGVLDDGQKVAVKRAQEGSLQGVLEFETEISLLSRVHHRNLVSLVGYCNEEGEQMLIYEFMPNGTLRDHVSSSSKTTLDFVTRLRIALGSARGIYYLHTQANPPIFHRDIKASNILLDDKFNARVADFGLSKLAPEPDLEGLGGGYVSTIVKGTPGYLDPEYFLTHKLTNKSDVYSFGVVLLVLFTGMQPISHGKNIVREVNVAYVAGLMSSIIDPRIAYTYSPDIMSAIARLALACCKDDPEERPTMTEVVKELEQIWKDTPYSDVVSIDKSGGLSGALLISESMRMKELSETKSTNTRVSALSGDVQDSGDASELYSETVLHIAPR